MNFYLPRSIILVLPINFLNYIHINTFPAYAQIMFSSQKWIMNVGNRNGKIFHLSIFNFHICSYKENNREKRENLVGRYEKSR